MVYRKIDYEELVCEEQKDKEDHFRRYFLFAYIIYLWIDSSIADAVGTVPASELIPLIVTSILVSLPKLAGFAAIVLLIRWLMKKLKTKADSELNF